MAGRINENGRRRIGVALGGGVVRGFAHLGVLSVLEDNGVPIDCLAGTSVGSLIGAFYCAGFTPKQILELAEKKRWGWRTLTAPVLSRNGLFSFTKLERSLVNILGHLHFEDLLIPFAVAATDIETGESIIIREGPLAPAVRASCSVPGVVEPAHLNGRVLVDGGFSNNLPVTAVRDLGADYVIGVDILTPTRRRFLGPLRYTIAAVEIMIEHAGGGIMAADHLIEPDLSGHTYLRFDKHQELIALGQQETENQIEAILADLSL